ncbi:hypothetical protein [Paenibacillus lutrae]|uniref:Ribbon-helix-helix protein CopG domain-containing protein n=1 Tax=Paenibacillus lutrae TaxID=2078573 RepID=A0A7X3FLT9_9BACL|nr:hypothetical protein [Paenibacillus lutrae]MVP02081.1 hypothetical protein [Paenibacillus lutrae]
MKNVGSKGRPSGGVTKKVSLTLPEDLWKHVDEEANGNRSQYLRNLINRDMWSGEWSNHACLGYAILGGKRAGLTEEQINKLLLAIKSEFDEKTVDEAKKFYL